MIALVGGIFGDDRESLKKT